jgi:transcriptional regulator with XRE-family HTH domain
MLLGAQLRRLREAAGITAEKAGFEIRASRSKISRMETGRVGLKIRDIEDLLTLFQTEDYARAVTRLGHQAAPAEEIERRVALRVRRQELLTRSDPPRIWMVMDEAVLRRPYGGADVMRAQIRHLIDAARMPHVTLQVVPFAHGGHAGAGGSFSILRFAERDLPDAVYIEQLTSAVYLDQRPDVEHYLEVVDQLSGEALTPVATTRFIEQVAKEIGKA